jgi:membrane fusion protein, multidrug efflux system
VLHKPQLIEREAKLTAAQADLSAAKLQLERCRLLAPFNGWVRDKRVSVGQYLNAGEKIAQLYADASAEVRLPVSSDQLEFLTLPSSNSISQLGPEVDFSARLGSKEQHWRGRIVRTTSSLDDKNAMLYAIAEIPDAFRSKPNQAALMPGQFVKATIDGIERYDLLSLPKSALFSGNQVYGINKEDKLKLHTVEILRNENGRIIISKGIAAGERILAAGVELPIEGMRIKIAVTKPDKKPISSVELAR